MWFFVLVVTLVFVYWRYFTYKPDTRKVVRSEKTNAVSLFARGLAVAVGKRQGLLSGPVSSVKVVLDVKTSPGMLEKYERATVFGKGKALSEVVEQNKYHMNVFVCYPQMLAIEEIASLVVDRGFPLSPLGVIHMRQTIVQHEAITIAGAYELQVFFARYPGGLLFNETDRGIELTVKALLSDKRSNRCVWEGESVLLSRRGGGGGDGGSKKAQQTFEKPQWDESSLHPVSSTTGLQYAAVSGDYNPHHLFWWSALPMGFSRPICHGMWTLASALHELFAVGGAQPDKFPLKIVCDFKKPLFQPSTITFGYKNNTSEIAFGVYDKENKDPYIICTLKQ